MRPDNNMQISFPTTHKSLDSAFFAKNNNFNERIFERRKTASLGNIDVKLPDRCKPETEVGSSGSSSTPI